MCIDIMSGKLKGEFNFGNQNSVCNSELLRWAVSHRNSSGLFLGLCVKCSTREKQIPSEVIDGNRNDVVDMYLINHSEVK